MAANKQTDVDKQKGGIDMTLVEGLEELKAQEAEALDILEAMLDVCDLDNPGPMFAGQHVRGGICKIMDDDATKLRQYIADRSAAPENKPLPKAPKEENT
jgi:hypothetical protein